MSGSASTFRPFMNWPRVSSAPTVSRSLVYRIRGQMPPPTYHCGGQVMASDTTSLSLPEFTVRQPMICFPQHGLNHRLFPAQGVEADLARVEIELRADQAVGPPRIDRIAPFQ